VIIITLKRRDRSGGGGDDHDHDDADGDDEDVDLIIVKKCSGVYMKQSVSGHWTVLLLNNLDMVVTFAALLLQLCDVLLLLIHYKDEPVVQAVHSQKVLLHTQTAVLRTENIRMRSNLIIKSRHIFIQSCRQLLCCVLARRLFWNSYFAAKIFTEIGLCFLLTDFACVIRVS